METDFTCTHCLETKDREDFYFLSWSAKPRQPCKDCWRARRRQHYADGNGIDKSYDQLLRREYGITLDQYNEMLRKQGSRCAICRRTETVRNKDGKVRRLAVDHDHATGAVRSLLCHRCNLLVWAIEDNHTTLDAISSYVERWQQTFANGAPI